MPDDSPQQSEAAILLVSADARGGAPHAAGDCNNSLVWLPAASSADAGATLERQVVHAVLLDLSCAEAERAAWRQAVRARHPAPLLVELREDGAQPREADLVLGAAIPDADLCAILHALLRQRAQAAAPDSQAVRDFVEAAPTIVIMLDRALRFIAVSAGYKREFGQDSRDLAGRHTYEVFPDLPEHWRRMHRDSLEGATCHVDEEHYARRDGTEIWVRGTTQPWHAANGAIGGVLIFTEFITRRKQAEETLRRNEQRYRMALRGPPVVVFEQDTELRYTWIDNPALEYQPDQVLGLTDFDLFENRDDAEITMALKRQVLEAGIGARQEVRVCHQGEPQYYDLTVEPLRDAQGGVIGVTCVALEITARKRAEAELAASQVLLHAVVEQVPAAIAIIEPPDGRNALRSRYSTRVFGAEALATLAERPKRWGYAEHTDGRPYRPEEYPGWRALHRGETGLAKPMLTRRSPDNRLVDIEVSAGPVRDAEGRIIAAVVVTFDVSERRATERALVRAYADMEQRVAERTRALSEAAGELAAEMRRREQAQAALLQAQKLDALGQMTGGIAHDFRNVLTAVSTNLGLLRERTPEPRLLRLVDRAEAAVQRANHLVAQLLAFARRQEASPRHVELDRLLPEFLDFACHSLPGGTRCALEVEPGIWPVLVDQAQLEVALLNLVVNARDAMPQGGTIALSARNSARVEGAASRLAATDCVAITVRDEGVGMKPDIAARATEPFFTTKGPERGTGLGLAMVEDFANRAGGHIAIASAEGQGTTVEIILPRAGTAPAAASTALPEAADTDAVILLVDDEEPFRALTAMFLRDIGYSVVEAGSAEAAYTLAHSVERLDLVITDLVMPGASGQSLAARLHAERPELRMLFITGDAAHSVAGTETVLRKPFQQAELAHAIAQLLGPRTTRD